MYMFNSLVVINMNDLSHAWCYTNDFTKEEDLKEVIKRNKESIKSWRRQLKATPDSKQLQRYLEQDLKAKFEVVTYEEYVARQREYYLSGPVLESTEESFNDMLNLLPPLYWRTVDGVEMFCMSEFICGAYTTQYARVGDKYYRKTVDYNDRSTWINELLKTECRG